MPLFFGQKARKEYLAFVGRLGRNSPRFSEHRKAMFRLFLAACGPFAAQIILFDIFSRERKTRRHSPLCFDPVRSRVDFAVSLSTEDHFILGKFAYITAS